jgi:hypothetical protein
MVAIRDECIVAIRSVWPMSVTYGAQKVKHDNISLNLRHFSWMAKPGPRAIEVILRYADESQVRKSVKGDDPKVRDLKNQIAEEFRTDAKNVVLRWNNAELVDDEPLSEIMSRAQRPTIDVVVDSKQYFPTRIFATQDRAGSEKHGGRVRPLPEERVYARQPAGAGTPRLFIGDVPPSSLYRQRPSAKSDKEKRPDLLGKSVWLTVFCCPIDMLPIVVRYFSQDGRDIIRVMTFRNDIVSLEFAKDWSDGWCGEEMQVKLVADKFAVVMRRGRYVQQAPALESGRVNMEQGAEYEWVDPAPRKGWWGTFVDFLNGFLV